MEKWGVVGTVERSVVCLLNVSAGIPLCSTNLDYWLLGSLAHFNDTLLGTRKVARLSAAHPGDLKLKPLRLCLEMGRLRVRG